MGWGLGCLFCVVLQKAHQLQWKQAMDFTGEECCRLPSHHGCFPCCYICFIFGDRINDPSNEYLKLPFFFILIGKIKAFSKRCVPLFCEVTTWFSSPVLPGCIHHAQCLFSAPGIQLQSVLSTLKKESSLVSALLSSGQQGLQ